MQSILHYRFQQNRFNDLTPTQRPSAIMEVKIYYFFRDKTALDPEELKGFSFFKSKDEHTKLCERKTNIYSTSNHARLASLPEGSRIKLLWAQDIFELNKKRFKVNFWVRAGRKHTTRNEIRMQEFSQSEIFTGCYGYLNILVKQYWN